jgi:hypothetical protein
MKLTKLITHNTDGTEVVYLPNKKIPDEYVLKSGCPIVGLDATAKAETFPLTTLDGAVLPCSVCGQDCKFSPKSIELLAHGKNPPMCFRCAMQATRRDA